MNFCMQGDGDEYQATAEGVCSYPVLCTMGETEADTQALCVPGNAPPTD